MATGSSSSAPGASSGLPPLSKHARLYVAGHRGMVGSAIVRRL